MRPARPHHGIKKKFEGQRDPTKRPQSADMSVVATPDSLRTFATQLLEKEGLDNRSSRVVAGHLVEANLCGHDSHGVGMLPQYVSSMRRGAAAKSGTGTVVVERGPILVIDANRSFGQPVVYDALGKAAAAARVHGMSLLAVRRAHHIGRVGAYAEQIAAQNLVCVCFANVNDHPPLVAPFGGSDARGSTNPIAIGVPLIDEVAGDVAQPLVHDFATSFLPLGKVRVAWARGLKVPKAALLDSAGRPTDNPQVMFPGCAPGGAYITEERMGALRAFGEHKGSGLNLACEFMGALAGGGTAADTSPNNRTSDRKQSGMNNLLMLVADPAAVGAPDFPEEVRRMAEFWAASPPASTSPASMSSSSSASEGGDDGGDDGVDDRADATSSAGSSGGAGAWGRVLLPGEAERLTAARRSARGIEIEESTWAALTALAEANVVPLPQVRVGPQQPKLLVGASTKAPAEAGGVRVSEDLLKRACGLVSVFALGFAAGALVVRRR